MPLQSTIASAETVIVGAGIVGCSIAYHLAEMGYTDVLVLDRGKMSSPLGSTGHAPGLLGRNSASSLMAALADYTSELFARMPQPNPALIRSGSIEVVRDEKRLEQLRYKIKAAAANGIEARLVSPEEIGKLVPYIDTKPIIGGIFVPGDGVLDARRALSALFEEAARRGIEFREETTVIGFQTAGDRITGVITEGGIINCSRVVVAVGIWGSELLEPLGIDLPLFAVQHPYVLTEPLGRLAGASQGARPFVRDLDNLFYLREHGDRLGFGWYNHQPLTIDPKTISKADTAFPEYGFLDTVSYELFPFLENTPLSSKLNGIFSMTADGGPLLGKIRPGLWIAEAVWVTHAGGVGKAMAELLLNRPPSFDVAAFLPDRFASISSEDARLASLDLYNNIYAWPTEVASTA
jgi:dimethylglycine oxidase